MTTHRTPPLTFRWTNVLVLRVHDADTIYVDVDLGLGMVRKDLGVRFAGINAPELATPEGKAALAFLETLVTPGDVVQVESLGFDNYGNRIDGRVFTGVGASLGAQVLAAGHALPLGPYTP